MQTRELTNPEPQYFDPASHGERGGVRCSSSSVPLAARLALVGGPRGSADVDGALIPTQTGRLRSCG